jgi:PAS domain S-box-containing protein
MTPRKADSILSFLTGGGEMGERMREKDWTSNYLGSPEFWQQSLRTTLSIILNSKFPMFLFWGKELICFYNDAYRPSLGNEGKHPSILGISGEEAWPEIWHIIKPLIDQVLSGGEATWSEDQLIPIYRNGKIEDVYWTFSYSPVNDESGKPAGVFVTCNETTDKVQIYSKLAESKKELEFAIEATELGTWDYNPLTNKFSSNQRLKNWFGLSDEDEIELYHAVNVILESDKKRVTEAIQVALDPSSNKYYDIEYTIVHPSSQKETIVHAKGKAWFNSENIAHRFNGTLEDITEQTLARRKVELTLSELQESNNRFINNIKHAPVAMCIFKGKNQVVEIANELMLELWGKTETEVVGKPIFEGLPEAKGQGLEQLLDDVLTSGEKYAANERPVKLPRNDSIETTYINFVYEPLKDPDGTISGVIAVATDVTLQVNARKQIELSEARFRSLINQSPMAMVVFKGPEQVIEIANLAMLKRWSKTSQELENKRLQDVFPEIKNQKFPALLDEVYKTGKVYRETEAVSYIHAKDGKMSFYVDFEYSPLFEADGSISGVIATVHDVTEKVTSRKTIEESQARYHNLIYSSPSAIGILYGEDLVITIANDAIIKIWGKGEEIMGKAYFKALPELAEQGYKDVFSQVFKTGIPFNAVETPVNILQDGEMTLKYYNFLLYPQRDLNNEIDGIGIIATEVTSQALLNNKIKESEKRFRLLADSMPQHIWTSDIEGNLNYFNQSVFEYSGLSQEQINKDGWIQIVHSEDRERNIKEWIKAITTGEDFLLEHRFRKYTGEYRWQLSRAIPQRDENGKIQMWVGTSTDIQEQKDFSKELERQVQERTKQLASNNVELEKMNKELQSFAYISSHDLQEPLRKIQTFTTLMLQREYANLSDSGKEYFKRMQNAALRMQTLIDDLLAYSRTTTAERVFEKTDLNKIIEDVKTDLKEEIDQKHATIEATELCEVNIIPFQFRQLMQNLFSNSLKFSKPGDELKIRVKSEIDNGSEFGDERLIDNRKYCHISISDNGIGFEPEFSSRIFELFQRLHGKEQYQGTGIGLAIVKKIVENHHGMISATGKLNHGATFDIYLPLS